LTVEELADVVLTVGLLAQPNTAQFAVNDVLLREARLDLLVFGLVAAGDLNLAVPHGLDAVDVPDQKVGEHNVRKVALQRRGLPNALG
jgi:hypothetical protein